MSTSDGEDRQRNRQIAENEAQREVVSSVRVSSWAIIVAVIVGVIAAGIVLAWLNR